MKKDEALVLLMILGLILAVALSYVGRDFTIAAIGFTWGVIIAFLVDKHYPGGRLT